jgi:periplasmic divalent cation tolerance protein
VTETSMNDKSNASANDEICIALTTVDSAGEAKKLAHMLVERRLAACVNILPGMRSVYRWKGRIDETEEVMLLIKTSRSQAAAVQAALAESHSYDLPEFLLLPIAGGSAAYLAWLRDGLGSV